MAVTAISTFYPPKIDTFAPAFIKTTSPNIAYELSPYNDEAIIQRVHVSLVEQRTNQNALTDETGIYIIEGLQKDEDSGLYYVTIPVDHILNSTGEQGWLNNTYYKLQLRFDSYMGQVYNNSDYFINNLEFFSEWSTVCLLRPIDQPILMLNNFESDENSAITFNRGIIPISGRLFFGSGPIETEEDTLQTIKAQVLVSETKELLLESDEIYTGDQVNPNSFQYYFDLASIDTSENTDFILRMQYTTRCQYRGQKDYNFSLADYVTNENFDPHIEVTMDDEHARATLHITNTNTVFGTIFIRRSSNLSNFKKWELIREEYVAGPVDVTVVDDTVGSLVWYRYIIQLEDSGGALSPIYYSAKIHPQFFDAYLSRGGRQFKLLFDWNITDMTPKVNRQKIDTIGGRYPKFVENASMHYKEFNVSGLISAEADDLKMFLEEREYFQDEYDNYTVWQEMYEIPESYNYLWEREFREEATEWLNDGEVKLYRSKTEGNLIVMLSNVRLTPNKTLSRRLWNFSATMTEVEDGNSLEIADSLGIYKVITPEAELDIGSIGTGGSDQPGGPIDYVEKAIPGQIYVQTVGDIVTGNVDILGNYIFPRIQERYAGVLENKAPREAFLTNVKITFLSQPHVFFQRNPTSPLVLVDDITQYNDEEKKKMRLGFSLEINSDGSPNTNKVFFVNQSGYYQIPENVEVTSLYFPQSDDVVLIEYVLNYKEKEVTTNRVTSQRVERTVYGQDARAFQPDVWVGEDIRRRYSYTIPYDFFQNMQWWAGISIDCAPFAMFRIQFQGVDTNWYDREVGFTGVLNLIETVPTQDIQFLGRRLIKVDAENLELAEEWNYAEDETLYNSWSEIEKPQIHMVYNIGGTKYIHYIDGENYPIVENYDGHSNITLAKVPIDGLLNYYGNVVRYTYG